MLALYKNEIAFLPSAIKSYFAVQEIKNFSATIFLPILKSNKNQPHLKSNDSTWTPPSGRHQTLDRISNASENDLTQKS